MYALPAFCFDISVKIYRHIFIDLIVILRKAFVKAFKSAFQKFSFYILKCGCFSPDICMSGGSDHGIFAPSDLTEQISAHLICIIFCLFINMHRFQFGAFCPFRNISPFYKAPEFPAIFQLPGKVLFPSNPDPHLSDNLSPFFQV